MKVLAPVPMKPITVCTIVSIALAAALLGASPVRGATAFESVVVVVDVSRVAPRGQAGLRVAQVRVADVRTESARELERTTIGGVSMGAIHLKPSAPELVQAIVEAKADEVLARRAVTDPPTVHCGIFEFEITTPATLLYWDVRTRIEVRLRVRDRERTIAAAETERTFIWPSQDVLTRVAHMALERLGGEAEQALEDLLLPPR